MASTYTFIDSAYAYCWECYCLSHPRALDVCTIYNYVTEITNRQHRAALSKFRCGILPLKIETWRFQDIPVEYRLCTMCDENGIETESQFLLYCSKYNQLRYQFLLT